MIYDYQSKQFGISIKIFKEYERGDHGLGKQLFSLVVGSYNRDFIDACISGKVIKIKGVEYLTKMQIVKFFGFRMENINRWRSQKRENLLVCLEYTPVCYVHHMKAHREAMFVCSALMLRDSTSSTR